MMLDWQGRVAECTGANMFFIKDGKIHTPIADCFLDGITRRTVIELAQARGIEVIERRIMPDELDGFSECFITGTAAEVTAVSRDRPLALQPGRHHQDADGRLHCRSAAEGRGGLAGLFLSAHTNPLGSIRCHHRAGAKRRDPVIHLREKDGLPGEARQ